MNEANENYTSKNGVLFDKFQNTLIQYPAGKVGASYTIADSVSSIGNDAFADCGSLTSITIPDSVTSIGNGAFGDCTSMIEILVDEANENYTSENGVLFDKSQNTLIQYPAGKLDASYIIPDSVTSIDGSAFKECTNLVSITIPDSVTTIGYYAFENCKNLANVTIGNRVTSIGSGAFCQDIFRTFFEFFSSN